MWTIAAGIVIAMFFIGVLILAFLIGFDLFIRVLDFNHRRRSRLRERQVTPKEELPAKPTIHSGPASSNR
jgi:hypothetical protein